MKNRSDTAHLIVVVIGLAILAALGIAGALAYQGKEIPALIATVVTGGLALLVPSPLSKSVSDSGGISAEPLIVDDVASLAGDDA
jgi:hypothetical protein